MTHDLQKASLFKRMAAGLFDWILTSVLTVGLAFLLSLILNHDSYSETLERVYEKYENEYSVTFDITQEEYLKMSESEKRNYDAAYEALVQDQQVIYAYNMTINTTLIITTVSILLGLIIWEFILPLVFRNGQTPGKKIFGLCLIRTDCVKINTMQLFVRTILGKFTVETMIPVYMILMLFLGIMDVTGTILLLILLSVQILILAFSRTNSLIHDLFAGTVVVDYSSQNIFRSTSDLIEYQKKIAAERAARQVY